MKRLLPILGFALLMPILPLIGQSQEQLFERGAGAYQDGLYEDALRHFNDYRADFPRGSRIDAVLYMEGVSLHHLKRYTQSLERLGQLKTELPDSPYLRRTPYWLGLNYYRLQDWNAAERAFQEQIDYSGESYFIEQSLLYLGALAEKKADWQAAADAYGRLLRTGAGTELAAQAWYRRGLALINLEDYHLALVCFETLTADYGRSAYNKAAPYYLGYCYYGMGEYDQARRRFELYLTLFPRGDYREPVLYQLARTESALGRWEKAEELLGTLKADYPGGTYDVRVDNMMAEYYNARGEGAAARKIWTRLYEKETDPNERDRLAYNLALSLQGEGEKERAAEYYKTVLPRMDSPVRPDSLAALAALYKEEEPALALGYGRTLFDDYPDYPGREEAGILVVNLMGRLNRTDQLPGHLKKMVELYPTGENRAYYLLLLAEDALAQGQDTRALEYLGQIVKGHAESDYYPDALYRLGYVYALRQEYARGAGYFETLLAAGADLTPEVEEDSRYSLALCHYRMENHDRAEALFLDYLAAYQESRRSGEIALYLGDLSFDRRSWEEAAGYYLTAGDIFQAQGDPRRSEALFNRALSLQKNEQWGEAEALFAELAAEADSKVRYESYYQAGICREKTGDRAGAERAFAAALETEEDRLAQLALYQMARLELEAGDKEKALVLLERMKADYPQGDLGGGLLYSEGEDYWALGEYALSREWYRLALSVYPDHGLADRASLRAARALIELNRPQQAKEELLALCRDAVRRQDPRRGHAPAGVLGDLLRSLADPAEALSALRSLAALTDDPGLLAPVALAALRTGAALKDEIPILTRIYEEEDLPYITRTEALLLLAGAREREGGRAEAQSLYRVVMESDRGALGGEAHYSLAGLIARDDPEEGAREYMNVSYNYPDQDEWAAKALYAAWLLYDSMEGREKKARIVLDKLKEEYPLQAGELLP